MPWRCQSDRQGSAVAIFDLTIRRLPSAPATILLVDTVACPRFAARARRGFRATLTETR
jgi:hypothetical protein